MNQNDGGMLQMIADALRGGIGGAGGQALQQQGSGYRQYVMDEAANGRQPMPEEQWMQMQQQQTPPQAPQGMPPQ